MMRTTVGKRATVVVMALVCAAPAAATAAEQPSQRGLSGGTATATGVFVTYQDQSFIIPGGTFPPPDIAVPYAAGSIDYGDTAAAVAAMGYSPYVELFGAINSVAPPGSPPFPAEAIAERSRASVNGQPPKRQDASMVPGADAVGAGTASARLDDGPVAEAVAQGLHLAPAPGVTVAEAATRISMSKESGSSVSESVTRLQDIVVNDLLRIESITLRARSGAGQADRSPQVTMNAQGVTVAGTAVRVTPDGLVVADQSIPMNGEDLARQLAQAGIRFTAPGRSTVESDDERALAEATGPEFALKSPNGEDVSITLGRAVAVTTTQAPVHPEAVGDGDADLGARQAVVADRPRHLLV
jgi:hypothetical protein